MGDSAKPGSAYGAGFMIRILVLLVLLGAVSFGFYYDRAVLIPKANATIDKAMQLLSKETDDGFGIPKDEVQRVIGFEPSSTSTEGDVEIETYRFQRVLPFVESQYISVVYENGSLSEILPQKPYDPSKKNGNNGVVAKKWSPDSLPSAAIAGGGGGSGGRRPGAPKNADEMNKVIDEYGDNPNRLNAAAWAIVEKVMKGDDVAQELVDAARKAADLAIEIEPDSGAILDTQAHLADIQGDLEEAIEIQKKAVEMAGDDQREPLEQYLNELMQRAEKGDKPETEPEKPADAEGKEETPAETPAKTEKPAETDGEAEKDTPTEPAKQESSEDKPAEDKPESNKKDDGSSSDK